MRIKAYGIKQEGGQAEPFYYERSIGVNEILVKIHYCSIARGDVQFISNDWGDTKFPLVPGHEIVGIVEETGCECNYINSWRSRWCWLSARGLF